MWNACGAFRPPRLSEGFSKAWIWRSFFLRVQQKARLWSFSKMQGLCSAWSWSPQITATGSIFCSWSQDLLRQYKLNCDIWEVYTLGYSLVKTAFQDSRTGCSVKISKRNLPNPTLVLWVGRHSFRDVLPLPEHVSVLIVQLWFQTGVYLICTCFVDCSA